MRSQVKFTINSQLIQDGLLNIVNLYRSDNIFEAFHSVSKMIKIPHGWIHCNPMASELVLGKFLAFKTPLEQQLWGDKKMYKFSVESVFNYLAQKNIQMGLWIDLSIPLRFDPVHVENQGCLYLKKQCGRNNKPLSVEETQRLIKIVRKFMAANPNKIIGVHCTHGHNRTGFVIVSFMIEIYGWKLDDALAEFARVRPPGIYRDILIDELRKRYGGNRDVDALPTPSTQQINSNEGIQVSAAVTSENVIPVVQENLQECKGGPNLYLKEKPTKVKGKRKRK